MTDVVPCPFCGGVIVKVIQGTTFRWRLVQCQECGAQAGEVRIQTLGDGTIVEWEKVAEKDAMEEWNRRFTSRDDKD